MIAKREQYLAGQNGKARHPPIEFLTERDPDNAEEALLILGVIADDPRNESSGSRDPQLMLEPWAVQAALARRRGGPGLRREQVSEIERCTRDPRSLRWPRGVGE